VAAGRVRPADAILPPCPVSLIFPAFKDKDGEPTGASAVLSSSIGSVTDDAERDTVSAEIALLKTRSRTPARWVAMWLGVAVLTMATARYLQTGSGTEGWDSSVSFIEPGIAVRASPRTA
jgi:hypothetical protein